MAVTKIKAIRGTLSKAIAYILNPEKTDEKLLVSSYGCASETAAREFEWTRKIAEQKGMNPVRIIARHVIQSFEIGEVTPELAHEIGKQFADEILGGKYEYVLTTHIDKDHVHNHLIFNAVDFVDYHAYKSYKRIYYDMWLLFSLRKRDLTTCCGISSPLIRMVGAVEQTASSMMSMISRKRSLSNFGS